MALQINTACVTKLLLLGFTGHRQELIGAWLKAQGAEGETINDLWADLFDNALIPEGQFNDRQLTWYKSQGAVGEEFNDVALDYWNNVLL